MTNPELVAARFLLKPVRKLIQERRKADGKRRTLIFVNNRLEGNALQTVEPSRES